MAVEVGLKPRGYEQKDEEHELTVYHQMKICLTQAFMFLHNYEWIANSYVAVSMQ